jgi:hypothetical protein
MICLKTKIFCLKGTINKILLIKICEKIEDDEYLALLNGLWDTNHWVRRYSNESETIVFSLTSRFRLKIWFIIDQN